MDTKSIPSMKPVLVDRISDDIRTLRQDEVTQQKTLITARGLADLFQCAPISISNPSDVDYFNTAGKVDLNLVTDASCRSLEADQYIHGPSTQNDEGTVVVYPAFLYVFTVLPSGALAWTDYDGVESIPETGTLTPDAQAPSPCVRQIIFSSTNNDESGNGTPWSRYGTYNEGTGSYDWENWFMLGKEHDGPGYFENFIINQASPCTVTDPVINANYRIYSEVTAFTLPDANTNKYKPGMKINVLMCPVTVDGRVSSAVISYTEKTSAGVTLNEMSILATPRLSRKTKDEAGNDVSTDYIPAEYTFEIVKLYDANGTEIGQTWELDGDVEESDFTGGFAQVLAEHTNTIVEDIVQYSRASMADSGVYKIAYPLQSAGYILAKFLKNTALTNDQWKAYVKLVNADAGAVFTQVVDKTVAPSSALTYYIKTTDGSNQYYVLAENSGHPTTFDTSKDYYSLNETNSNMTDIIEIVDATGVKRNYLTLADLTNGTAKCFSKFANHNDIVVVVIDPGSQLHSYYRSTVKVSPTVTIYPDPHDMYVQKIQMNPSAFTAAQLVKLRENGNIVDDGTGTLKDAPVSSRALLNAYSYLAGHLQSRGALLGSVLMDNLAPNGLNTITADGLYVAVPATGSVESSSSTFPEHTPSTGGSLIVITNKSASASLIHEDEGTITEATHLYQIFIFNDSVTGETNVYIRSASRTSVTADWVWIDWRELGANSNGSVINKMDVDLTSYQIVGSEVQSLITKDMVTAALDKYQKPIFMVGIKSAKATDVPDVPSNPVFVSCFTLPDATASELTNTNPSKRREFEIWFYGTNTDYTLGWTDKKLRVKYQGLSQEYSYERTWSGSEAITKIKFTQIDMPGAATDNPERLWIPEEAGQ